MVERILKGAFTVLFVAIVGGLTWLIIWPMKWVILTYGLWTALILFPVTFVISVVVMKWLEGPRH